MALTDSSRIYNTQVTDIRYILEYCERYFTGGGYSVTIEDTLDGGFISLTKGGMFESIAGMSTGLNITIKPMPGALCISMKVGIFGKQAVPTAISMLVFWPVLIPQIYGLVQQNKLDTEAYNVIASAIQECEKRANDPAANTIFCPYCGKSLPASADFCVYCGKRVTEEPVACPNCGAAFTESFAFCPKCGTPMQGDTEGK